MRDPYDVLGVSKNASEADIKKAFRSLAKTHHPDKRGGDAAAQKKFQEISAAYDIVGDKDKRAKFDQGVIECFKKLSWEYKTNLPQKFGKRIIVTYLSYPYGINSSATDRLDDLMRVFHVLDGKPEADYRQGCYAQLGKAFREQTTWPKSFQNDYFEARLFRNGNGHLCFKRADLTDAMNAIIARHYPNALAAPR